MEDAATAEISRAQMWQWVKHEATMDDGRKVTPDLVRQLMAQQIEKLKERLPERHVVQAGRLYDEMIFGAEFADFLTLRAYDCLD
jgi:malate synthase